jgi:hypothetical protein
MLIGPSSEVSEALLPALARGLAGELGGEGMCDDAVLTGMVYASLVVVMLGVFPELVKEGFRCRS